MADPDLEQSGGAWFFRDVETKLICEYCLPCRLFFLLRFFIILFIYFFCQNNGGPGPPGPLPLIWQGTIFMDSPASRCNCIAQIILVCQRRLSVLFI